MVGFVGFVGFVTACFIHVVIFKYIELFLFVSSFILGEICFVSGLGFFLFILLIKKQNYSVFNHDLKFEIFC